ncbi:hypothetical protein ABPG77_004097 [Micractinium sp. CCAP 211/92]
MPSLDVNSLGSLRQVPELELRPATTTDVKPLSQLYAAAFEANPAYRWIFSGSPHEPAPPGALEWLFARRVCLLLHCGCPVLVAVDRGSGALVGAAGLSPFSRKPGMWHFLRHGILLWPLWYGWSSLNRALNIDKKLVHRVNAGRPSGSGSEGSETSSPNGSGDGGSSGSTEHPGNSVSCSNGQNGSDSGHSGPSRDGMDPAGSSGGSKRGRRGITGEVVMMAVHPTLQGRGIGGRLLCALLTLWDAEHGGGLVLSTQEEHALRMYKAHGFQEPEDAATAGPADAAAAPAGINGPGSDAGGPAGGARPGPSDDAGAAFKSWVLVRPVQVASGACGGDRQAQAE